MWTLVLLALLWLCHPGRTTLSSSEDLLYPFGLRQGDSVVPVIDDGSTGRVNITIPFPFFDQLHSSLYVNTNGVVSFLKEVSQYTPEPFPLGANRRLVAPFWADVDTERNQGRVFWRQTRDDVVLSRVSPDVRSIFVDHTMFEAIWALVVTWDGVTFYGGDSRTPVNTFQAVLATNGRHSFVLFNYVDVTWTTGKDSGGSVLTGLGGTQAQAGFNAGDGVRYFNVPGSRTAAIVDVETTTNVGLPGRWMFRVDESTVEAGGCNTAGSLVVGPRFASPLGGRRIYVVGPCFDANNDDVVCNFDGVTEPGDVISTTRATCITPITFFLGRRPFMLSTDGGQNFPYMGFFWFVEQDSPEFLVHQLDTPAWFIRDLYQNLVISWDARVLNSTSVNVDFVTFRKDGNGHIQPVVVPLMLGVANTGQLQLPDRLFHAQQLELATFGSIKVTEVDQPQKRQQSLWSPMAQSLWYTHLYLYEVALQYRDKNDDIHNEVNPRKKRSPNLDLTRAWKAIDVWVDVYVQDPKEALSKSLNDVEHTLFDDYCNEWYEEELANPADFSHVPPPPCNLGQATRDPDFVPDSFCSFGEETCQFYHHGAGSCIRSAQPSFNGAGQEACYNSKGRLLPFDNGGGTCDKSHLMGHVASSKWPLVDHFLDDVSPFLQCCKLSRNWNKYAQARPSMPCTGYQPPRPARSSGDPHMTTLDGVEYTFNGVGEFVVLRVIGKGLEIQGRAEKFKSDGASVSASVWTAFALHSANSSTVQVSVNERLGLQVLVDGEDVDFDEHQSWNYDRVTVSKPINQTQVGVRFVGGPLIQISEVAGALTFLAWLKPTVKGKTRGLLGVWNDDPSDDLLTPDGDIVSVNASMRTIHYNFGVKWRTLAEDSLFTYPAGRSHASFQHTDFEPTLELPTTDNATMRRMSELCGTNFQCQFDLIVTGNEAVAIETKKTVEEYNIAMEEVKPVMTCEFLKTPSNGQGNITNGPVGETVVFMCDAGYTVRGSAARTCLQDGTWSGIDTQCQALDGVSLPLWAALFISVLVVMAMVAIALVVWKLYFSRRKELLRKQ